MKYKIVYALTELVMDYSYKCKIFDEDFIKEAYNIILSDNKELQSMINGVPHFSNSFGETKNGKVIVTGASYNIQTGDLTFCREGMALNLKGELTLDSNTKLGELEYYIYMNLGAIRDIIHELEHVRQAKIMRNENSDLSKLISNVQAKKGTFTLDFFRFLMANGYTQEQIFALSQQLGRNYQFSHDLFPTERAANTKSQSDIFYIAQNISESAHIDNLLEFLHKKIHNTAYDGYSFRDGQPVQTPIDLFASIQTLLGDMYERFSGQQIFGSMIRAPITNEEDIILYGGEISDERLNKFTK